MTDWKKNDDTLAFEQEPLHDADFTLEEVMAESKRCLHCAVPQCSKGCPIHNEIPQFIAEVKQGNWGKAAEHIRHNSWLPGICGRVCPREKQCEGSCVLGRKGRPVAIGKLERFVSDMDFAMQLGADKKKGKAQGKVAIIGSGPAGLAAAYELVQRQYEVTILEQAEEPGGMLLYGIPAFRLHKQYVYREAERLEALGVTFQYGKSLGKDFSVDDLLDQGYDTVFLGIGTSSAWSLGVENDAVSGVVDAQQFLHQLQQVQLGIRDKADLPIQAGDKVIVVGAGNVAIDAARSALRLQSDVTIVYRRAEKNMKCLPSEYEEAKADGVKFQFYSAPKAVVGTDHVEGLRYEKQQILEDATMVPTGEFGVVPANKIIAAIGNCPELSCIQSLHINTDRDGHILTKDTPYGMTSRAGVFAAGDIVHKPATVVLAMREGKKVAASMDAYMQAKKLLKDAL